MSFWCKLQEDKLEMCTNALCALLQAQPALTDQVPSLGHIPRLCKQLGSHTDHNIVHKAAILVLHQLALSEVSFLLLVFIHL